MASRGARIEIRVQMWRLMPCIWIARGLLALGIVDECRAVEMMTAAALRSIRVGEPGRWRTKAVHEI